MESIGIFGLFIIEVECSSSFLNLVLFRVSVSASINIYPGHRGKAERSLVDPDRYYHRYFFGSASKPNLAVMNANPK